MRRTFAGISLVLAATLLAGSAAAEDDEEALVCDEPHDVDRFQLLRRLSLDLRGSVPTIEEYQALEAEDLVPAETIQEMIESDDFRVAMRRYHELAFWPNVSNVRMANQNTTLGTKPEWNALRVTSTGKGKLYRGDDGQGSCANVQQTQFDPAFPGEFRPKAGVTEGWRMVAPYWDPATPIKVCAYDAQESLEDGGVACNTPESAGKKGCGCGPGLRFCYGPAGVTNTPIVESLREQLGRSVDEVTAGGAPYTDLMLSTKAWQNGKIAHWKKNLAPYVTINLTYNVPDPDEEVLAKDFTDDTWEQVDRKGLHAGILTLPGYLLRFQTGRGRANRFRIAFLCEYFVPPADLTPAAGCDEGTTDLMQRCNCQYCHQKLEPLSAFFGQFSEAGTTLMSDEAKFPRMNEDCVGSGSAFCKRFYITDPEAYNAGSLLAYQWADLYPEVEGNLAEGVRALAEKVIDDGSFAHCTVRKVFSYFIKRDIRAQGVESEELPLFEALSDGFEEAGFSFPWLVREIVSLPQYRRVR
ncbi:MAG: hypothetical protein WKG00_15180 [Polyangiaceae bacterium]